MRRGAKLLVGVLAGLMLLPAAASAAVKTYGGTADIGGNLAMDVKLNKKGVAKRILEIRGEDLIGTCETSGPGVKLNLRVVEDLTVAKGKFHFKFTDEYGNKSRLDGKFSGKKDKRVSGTFVYANHFAAEGPYPEENCGTAKSGFSMKKGGADVQLPGAAARR